MSFAIQTGHAFLNFAVRRAGNKGKGGIRYEKGKRG
jgi:hypothetical protein